MHVQLLFCGLWWLLELENIFQSKLVNSWNMKCTEGGLMVINQPLQHVCLQELSGVMNGSSDHWKKAELNDLCRREWISELKVLWCLFKRIAMNKHHELFIMLCHFLMICIPYLAFPTMQLTRQQLSFVLHFVKVSTF